MATQPPLAPWAAGVITLFPELFPGPLDASVIGRARAQGLWSLDIYDLKAHAHPAGRRTRRVDAPPAGGGPGMILRADVAAPALDAARARTPDLPIIFPTPAGAPLTQARVRALAEGAGVLVLCARFEGMDERVLDTYDVEEVSLGDFVLAGGEIAACALIEACVRLRPGVLGAAESVEEESFAQGLLEYPQYALPRVWKGQAIPPVLLSGDHGAVAAWRRAEAEARTKARRPDLWKKHRRS